MTVLWTEANIFNRNAVVNCTHGIYTELMGTR